MPRRLRSRGGIAIPLGQMLTIDQFRAVDDQISYPTSGSFVRFLLDTQGGVPRIRELFGRATHHDAAETTRRNLEAVYGKTLEALEAEWHAYLDAR